MASTTKPALPPLVTDPATATQLALAGWTSTVAVDPTQTALDIDLPSNTAGLVLLLQPSKAPVLQNGCAECGPPISCLMCPSSFQCLMGVQTDCSTCPPLRCVALSDGTTASASSTASSTNSTASETPAPSEGSASPKIIGGVLGGVGGLIILALVMFFILWNKKHRKQPIRNKSKINRTRSPNLKKRDASGIIIDDNYLRELQDPLGCVRESHAELHEDRNSYKSLSTLFEDNSSTSSPKSPILIYTRRERTNRVRTPVLHQQFEHTDDTHYYEPDLIVPQPAQPVHQPRGLSAIFHLPKPITSRLSLGSLFSDTGRLSLSFKSSPSSSVKQDTSLPQFSTPSTARDSSLTMSSNASNIIPIAYMPGVLDYSSIADQYSAYQERKAARRRENQQEAKTTSEHVEDVSDYDPYMSPVDSTKNSSPRGSPLKEYTTLSKNPDDNGLSSSTTTRFGPPLSSIYSSPILQPPPLNTIQHIPNSSSLSTLFHAPSTPVPATPPLNVSGKFVSMIRETHSHQSSISSIATMSTASFERLWDQTGALVADENHIPPSPPSMNTPSALDAPADCSSPLISPASQTTDMQFVSAPTSPHMEVPSVRERYSTSGVSDPSRRISTPSMAESAISDPQQRYSMTTTASFVSGESAPYLATTSSSDRPAPYAPGELSVSRESLTSIQPSVIISRASTMTRNRIEGRAMDVSFPPRSSSLRRTRSDRGDTAP
ncbi:hypothetical protein B0I72DRAFT_41950 [Yarrowia lipolytica]|uniref:YALI0A07601p n=2 Tax=Yarrowia lipolytica TaxID=4952 RepID=Q6CHL7_YARLI|nr:YALI0A07601p [Yarrowia lipolytica CLIB122]AOW00358.1 hypothetical protein YALI1_A07137g [Yarrowia lipolytica]KAB8281775.1 hypothetical protein BKA91DRAFT_28965 [Yarrowia lipolytica]KAE8170412.1 hypothetical protein BKA90DRAFT_36826 [Yarrowia lipolytica]KAJ8051448.1 hypothetical protein LXG23DRAFT_39156 [Yarrowia lipolytica]RDW26314.1 hypothetical protein B0I71DRAFT_32710 [Yarrowia lipolytica]|eukprot:XP_499844.1 YALI0A07601p [Yarrowia lipolytica CLIB122]